MQKTGLSQATVVYKTSLAGNPLDIDGELITVSGKKQAIGLLQGAINPDTSLYEIEFYFQTGEIIFGNSTQNYGYSCPQGVLKITPEELIILTTADPVKTLSVISSADWQILSPIPSFVDFSATSGILGQSEITLTKKSTQGQGDLVFRQNFTGELITFRVINVNSVQWVLTGGTWANLGLWQATGIWQTI